MSSVATTAGRPTASLWQRIRRDVVLLGAGNIAIVVAQLGFRSLLISSLVPAAYGRLSLVLSIYNTVWIVGASGLPNSVARYIARIAPADDSQIIRSALRAGVWPTVVAGVIVACVAGVLLRSPLAVPLGAFGLSSLVYSLITMGILRGRGRMGAAATVMPLAALGELLPLASLRVIGLSVTPLSAFAIFCAGNAVGLLAGTVLVLRSAPASSLGRGLQAGEVPGVRQLLGASMWLALATISLSGLPLVLRTAAALDSYTVVAVVDVALVLFAFPQRLGAIVVMAVTPHVSRAIGVEGIDVGISRKQNLLAVLPFAAIAAVVAFTPLVGWLFGLIGRPIYGKSAEYLALALLAGPARVLYGVVEGVLIAHGEGKVMALTALSVSILAGGLIYAAAALGSPAGAFGVFVAALWSIYLLGLARIGHLTAAA